MDHRNCFTASSLALPLHPDDSVVFYAGRILRISSAAFFPAFFLLSQISLIGRVYKLVIHSASTLYRKSTERQHSTAILILNSAMHYSKLELLQPFRYTKFC